MVFSSGVFLFIFLPVVLILHTVVKNNKARNALLIAASLLFYAYGEPIYVLLMIGSVVVNYLFGRVLAVKKNKGVLAVAVVLNIGLLVLYKYTNFIITEINRIFDGNIHKLDLVMPIGISFFTFQAISYIVDVYRSDKQEKQDFFHVLLYISLFPQLIAGPIVKYNSIRNQIDSRRVTPDKMAGGMRRFGVGLAKKMLIANMMAKTADAVFAMDTASIEMPLAWLGGICYTLQIYFDFSGYSDMALGIGEMLGFDFPENFNYPYSACGMRDFWRRWHMSLTGWFREYLYIPLGGNRKGKARRILNSMIVFLCTGIWHGANTTFAVWGIYHGLLMSLETLVTGKKKTTRFNPFKWLYTIIFVIIGFVIFRADTLMYSFRYIGRMFDFRSAGIISDAFLNNCTPLFITTFVAAVIGMWPLVPFVKRKTAERKCHAIVTSLGYAAAFVLYILCIMTLAADSYNPFIYFRF